MSRYTLLPSSLLLIPLVAACTAPGESTYDKRESVDVMAQDVLGEIYDQEPQAKEQVADAAGYAVFSNIDVSVLVVGGAGGYGVAVDNTTGERTYMRMGQADVGLGLGVKDFRGLFVFDDEQAFDDFVERGWNFGGEADAALKAGEKGGEVSEAGSLREDVHVYQITESGIALRANLTGATFWPYEELN